MLPENMARVPQKMAAPLTFWRESCDKWPVFERFEVSPLFLARFACLKRGKGSAYILADTPIIRVSRYFGAPCLLEDKICAIFERERK